MTDKNKKFWWEKTIEYLFVMRHIKVDDLIVPLDGNHEISGDAILGRVSKWILIEFKRDETSLASEERKYGTQKRFNEARESLLFESNHHYFIYGAINEGKLTLNAKGYFNLIDIPVALLLASGKDATSFTLYLKKLMNFKVGKEESDGSSGWRSVDYNRVIGIDESGDVSECLTIQEYANRYSHDLDLKKSFKLEQERKRSLEIKKNERKIDAPKPW